jgi:hypothetical protein
MKTCITIIFICLCTMASAQHPTASTRDFKTGEGSWKGTLTYLDYGSGKPFTMPADVVLRTATPGMIIFSYSYPKEPKANGNDTLFISQDGSMIDGARVVEKSVMEDGAIKIITDKDGVDGNDGKKAVIRHYYIIGKNIFQSRKEVRFEGTEKWIKRNEYLFSR